MALPSSTDVCIIGSGVAGAIVASELLRAGVGNVVMIEAGSKVLQRDRRKWLDYVSSGQNWATLYPEAMPEEPVNKGTFPYITKLLHARGGSTLVWTGWALRLMPEDFRLKTNTGLGSDWPISYEELEPFYVRAEATLQVSGEAADHGHPPRSAPFPLPAHPYQLSDDPFLKAMRGLGYSVQHAPFSRNTKPINGQAQCQTVGTCKYCPFGAAFNASQVLDRLELENGFRLITGVAATELSFRSRDSASAVSLLDLASGETHTVEAQAFVVCGGGIESPKLLLRSTNPWWRSGVGNDHDNVGRYLMNHLSSFATGSAANPNLYFHETGELSTAMSRHFDAAEHQLEGKFLLNVAAEPALRLQDMMALGMSGEEIRSELARSTMFRMQAVIEQLPDRENRLLLGDKTTRHGLRSSLFHYSLGARDRSAIDGARAISTQILERMGSTKVEAGAPGAPGRIEAHHLGTCRMGDLPEESVVDRSLRIHDTNNVYVCSSATFPTAGSANPTLTIAALAHRLGQELGLRLRGGR